jgi:phage recombination protein Bet
MGKQMTRTESATDERGMTTIRGPRLPYVKGVAERFGVDQGGWKVLCESVFPNANNPESIVLALAYCKQRGLDVFKRVVHIVAIWSTAEKAMIDSVWPAIAELRTTAFRTGSYAGREDTRFGPDITKKLGGVEITFPEWAQVTVYRLVHGVRVPFVGPRVYWLETYATAKRDTDAPNSMWAKRTRGQLDKCAEAAALRAAFPEELGGELIPEEVEQMNGRMVVTSTATPLAAITEQVNPRIEHQPETVEPPVEEPTPPAPEPKKKPAASLLPDTISADELDAEFREEVRRKEAET